MSPDEVVFEHILKKIQLSFATVLKIFYERLEVSGIFL